MFSEMQPYLFFRCILQRRQSDLGLLLRRVGFKQRRELGEIGHGRAAYVLMPSMPFMAPNACCHRP